MLFVLPDRVMDTAQGYESRASECLCNGTGPQSPEPYPTIFSNLTYL